ncbi:hypothetical protein D5085_08565 [Ectothiorhodospiraceae bacterium BW-2]|nr:hypothetical protein D5085_08565 [Ectothiorhodospiraceae bacterium BW-2]
MSQATAQDYDSPWKEALEYYFADFLQLLFPQVCQLIDWTEAPVFLDKELQKITGTAADGRTYADKLIQVTLCDGKKSWLLIHVEVQGEPESDFAARMFRYNYRIRDRYHKDVVSLAVLSDSSPAFKPDRFQFSLAGCEIDFRFPVVKLLDWRERLNELLNSTNPFALIVAAQLQVKLIPDPTQRLNVKSQLIRLLYQRRYSRDQILELFKLIDWMIRLPDNLEIQFKQIVDQIEQEQQMAYITSVERIAMQEGRQEGRQETLLKLIQLKFGIAPEWVETKLHAADRAQLDLWVAAILTANTIEELFSGRV